MGGHTFTKHVAKSNAEMLHRARTVRNVVSSYTNVDITEKAISQVQKANKNLIKQWSGQSSSILRFNCSTNYKVGGQNSIAVDTLTKKDFVQPVF